MLKTTTFYAMISVLLSGLSGCGVVGGVVNMLDASSIDNQRVYRQAEPMPPLEVPASLAHTRNTQNDYSQDER